MRDNDKTIISISLILYVHRLKSKFTKISDDLRTKQLVTLQSFEVIFTK